MEREKDWGRRVTERWRMRKRENEIKIIEESVQIGKLFVNKDANPADRSEKTQEDARLVTSEGIS